MGPSKRQPYVNLIIIVRNTSFSNDGFLSSHRLSMNTSVKQTPRWWTPLLVWPERKSAYQSGLPVFTVERSVWLQAVWPLELFQARNSFITVESVVVVVGGCGVSVTTVWRIDAERAKKRWFMAGVWKLPELWPPHIPRYTGLLCEQEANFSVSLVNDHLNCQPPRCPFARVGRWRKSLWKRFVNFLSDSYV